MSYAILEWRKPPQRRPHRSPEWVQQLTLQPGRWAVIRRTEARQRALVAAADVRRRYGLETRVEPSSEKWASERWEVFARVPKKYPRQRRGALAA